VHASAGIDYQYFNGQTGYKYLLESMGGGVAVLDYDNDGWPDLYVPQGCQFPVDPDNRRHVDRLFRNTGQGTFVDVTRAAGLGDHQYSQGCAVADYDNDGDQDIVVANFGPNTFYRNNGDGTFSEVADAVGLQGQAWSSSLALADLNRDGNLDLYVVNYVDQLKVCRTPDGGYACCDPANFNGQQDRLYQSRGDGRFQDVTNASGILHSNGNGLGVLIVDLDDDRWPDIYVANDTTPNFLFHNERSSGPPTFTSHGLLAGVAVSGEGQAQGSMGIACADFDDNGLLDLCVTNFYGEGATMYLNRGNLMFEDGTRAARLLLPTKRLVGFGVQAPDLDLDGRRELFMANGHIDDFSARNEPWKMPPKLFRRTDPGLFEEVSPACGDYFSGAYLGRGAACLDWDRDGDPDLAVVHQDAPLALLSNETPASGGVLILELHGVVSNRDAVGARIHVTAAGRSQVREICGGDGFYATNERAQHIGIGPASTAELVEVVWPAGSHQRLTNVSANSRIVFIEGQAPRVTPIPRAG
jgi:hypothetical protein